MTSASTTQTQAHASTPLNAADDDRARPPNPDAGLPPLHVPTLVTALEEIGLVDPVLVGHDALTATLTFSARRPQIDPALTVTAELGVFVDVDITTGLLIERSD